MDHTLVLNKDWQPISTLPISSLNWKDAMSAVFLGTVQPIHYYENWTVHSQKREFRVPSVVCTTAYVTIRRFVGFSDEMVFLRDGYRCQYCGEKFNASKLTKDHVVPKSMGGLETFDNISSSCGPCNWRRGTNTKIQPRNAPYRPTHGELNAKRRLYPVDVPHASWIDYIGWSSPDLVRVIEPKGMPGYKPICEAVEALQVIDQRQRSSG